MNDGTDKKRTILSGIHEYYEPEQLVGKTCVEYNANRVMGIIDNVCKFRLSEFKIRLEIVMQIVATCRKNLEVIYVRRII